MKKTLIALGTVLFLASCTGGALQDTPELNFSNVTPIPLNAARIEVRDDYAPPMHAPNVEHTFRPPPALPLRDLLNHALTAAGGQKTLRVIIEDASVIDRKLTRDKGIMDTLNPQPSDRYDGRISLRFELFDPAAPDIVTGHANVVAKRSTTIMSNFTLADRDRAAFTLTEGLMHDVQDSLNTTVRNTFGQK
jgi:hypothetical protein